MTSDLRDAFRSLLKNPSFTAVALVTLALGIGANTAIFSLVHAVLLRPLPYGEPERLVRVVTSTAERPAEAHSAADFRDLRHEQQSLQAIAAYRSLLFSAAIAGGDVINVPGTYVTSEFFDVLRVPASLGRVFSQAEDSAGGRKVVLAHGTWRRLFQDRQDIIGHAVRVDGEPHTVVGVLPPHAEWPRAAGMWVLSPKDVPPTPIEIAQPGAEREVRYFDAIGRIRQGVTAEQAQLDLSRVAAIVQSRNLPTAARRGFRMVPLREELVGDVRQALVLLQAAVAIVLLIACANVASLLIARSTGRKRELAIRAALGARRARLVRQLLTESLLLSAAGGLLGLLAGAWMIGVLARIIPDTVPRADAISLDGTVAGVTIVVALLTGAVFGIVPALQASRADGQEALSHGSGRTSTGGQRRIARAALVISEVALTVVLLTGAGLLVNSLLHLQRVDSGFTPEHATMVELVIPQTRYPTAASQIALYSRLLESLSRHGEIDAVGIGFPGPLRADNASGSFTVEGFTQPSPSERPFANIGSVSGGFFRAMGIPLIAGRTFTGSDVDNAPPVAIVNRTLARRYWPGSDPVGKRLRFDDDERTPWIRIVGVVGDARQRGLHHEPPPVLYFPYQQFALPFTNIAIRSAAPMATIAGLVRKDLAALAPDLPPGDISSLQSVMDESISEPRFRTMLLTAFAAIAVILAAVGIYGLLSHSVFQRTREIGIHMALGARPSQVLMQVVREGLLLSATGAAIGIVVAIAATTLLSSFLFGIDATDPPTYVAVVATLMAVSLLASYIPARRALRVDPIAALRAD